MDSSDWLQGSMHEDTLMDSSSSPSGDMITCSRPMIERRLRPQLDQALKCPRCDSTHTKFCYYNNYSLSQPRYFCKTCRRYWTKGGTLRNIPVGGGCRKNKKVSTTKKSNTPAQSSNQNPIDNVNLQLSFPDMQFAQLSPNFIDYHRQPIDFMETNYKIEEYMGNADMGMLGFGGMVGDMGQNSNLHGYMDGYQRLMLPYEGNEDQTGAMDVKPNNKILTLDWHDQGYNINGLGSWGGMINGYGSSAPNPLV